MAIREYQKVDLLTGVIIDVCLFDSEVHEIPEDCFLGWGDRTFYNPVYNFKLQDWVEGKPYIDILNDVKSQRDAVLNQACMDAILAGFEHEVRGLTYQFSFDTQAQFNFQGAVQMFQSGLINEITWTVQLDNEYVRINLDKHEMDELSIAVLKHKNNNIARYRDELLPLVMNAQTIEEVNAVNW